MSINSKINGHPNANDEHPSEGLCRRFSLAEIRAATNDFDEGLVIGKGGFGEVYKGWLEFDISGTTKLPSTVAIKKLNAESKQGAREFWSEIKALTNLRHPHLVTLYGYCEDSNEMILVYDYMSNGTLADHLHKLRKGKAIGTVIPQSLTWEQRLNICIGAARGLAFLHTNTEHTVIHRDVKTSNILLDENWVAKISDFGLSKIATTHTQTHISTDVKGTFGYLDPEYYMTRRLTKKSDVYAFGVVLFEVLSARPAVGMKAPDEEQGGLATWARDCMKRGALDQIIDPFLKDKVLARRIEVFAEFAETCLHNHSNERPTMVEVVESLQLMLASQGNIRQSNAKIEKVSPTSTLSRIVANIVGWRKRILSFGPNISELQRDRFASSDVYLCRRFTLKEILLATNNFNMHRLVKDIDPIYVYRGVIDQMTEVAIKRLKDVTRRKEFVSDIKLLTKLSSLHIVSLIGYCDERNEAILVYEFMANGSLRDHLYETSGKDPLSWEKRLEICIDVARGLQYLHAGTKHTIVHNGLSCSRILLDRNWVAKVSGFESHIALDHQQSTISVSAVRGHLGYLAPEYLMYGTSSVKSDVYSFGVILLAVLSGRKPMDFSVEEDQVNLVRWFKTNIEKGIIDKIIDPRLLDKIEPECLIKYVQIAGKCLEEQATERPNIEDVWADLRTVMQLQRRPRNMGVPTEVINNLHCIDTSVDQSSFATLGDSDYGALAR